MLISLKNYIVKKHRVTIEQLARHFHCSAAVIEAMVSFWEERGVLYEEQHDTVSRCFRHCASSCGEKEKWICSTMTGEEKKGGA